MIVRGIRRMRDVRAGSIGRRLRGRLTAYLCDDWVDGWIEIDYLKTERQTAERFEEVRKTERIRREVIKDEVDTGD